MSRKRFLGILPLVITITAPASAAQIVQTRDVSIRTEVTTKDGYRANPDGAPEKLLYSVSNTSEVTYSFPAFDSSLGVFEGWTFSFESDLQLLGSIKIKDVDYPVTGNQTADQAVGITLVGKRFPFAEKKYSTKPVSCGGPEDCFNLGSKTSSLAGSLSDLRGMSPGQIQFLITNKVTTRGSVFGPSSIVDVTTASTGLVNGRMTLTYFYEPAAPGPLPGVPEPSQWALMIVGFAVTGAALRSQARTRCAVA